MKQNSYLDLSKIFSPVFLDNVANGNTEKVSKTIISLKKMLPNLENKNIAQIFNTSYSALKKNYRNEYFYKNTLFNNIILKNHNLNNCLTLTEFTVGDSKLDVAVFNGTTTAYEIKSEKDSPKRLFQQLRDYVKSFEFVYLVTYKDFAEKVLNNLPKNIGILILSDDMNSFYLFREPTSNFSTFEYEAFFNSLRINEIKNIIFKKFGFCPDVPNTLIYKECFNLFCKIPINELHILYIYEIRNRDMSKIHKELIKSIPKSIKVSTISKRYNEKQCENIVEALEMIF